MGVDIGKGQGKECEGEGSSFSPIGISFDALTHTTVFGTFLMIKKLDPNPNAATSIPIQPARLEDAILKCCFDNSQSI